MVRSGPEGYMRRMDAVALMSAGCRASRGWGCQRQRCSTQSEVSPLRLQASSGCKGLSRRQAKCQACCAIGQPGPGEWGGTPGSRLFSQKNTRARVEVPERSRKKRLPAVASSVAWVRCPESCSEGCLGRLVTSTDKGQGGLLCKHRYLSPIPL